MKEKTQSLEEVIEDMKEIEEAKDLRINYFIALLEDKEQEVQDMEQQYLLFKKDHRKISKLLEKYLFNYHRL